MTSGMLGEDRLLWGAGGRGWQVLVFPVARHLGLSILETLGTWPIILAVLLSNCLSHMYCHNTLLLYRKFARPFVVLLHLDYI